MGGVLSLFFLFFFLQFSSFFLFFFFSCFFFFFQAEDGIRDWSVTGVQTCALPICVRSFGSAPKVRRTSRRECVPRRRKNCRYSSLPRVSSSAAFERSGAPEIVT